jgi:hypothetical protein
MNFEAGRRYSLALMTGVMAAGLAANAPIFAMRLSPAASVRARFDRIRLQMSTIAAFTVPVTAGRAIQIIRGHTAAMTGGVAVTDEGQKIFSDATSQFDDNNGGDVRIASTAALTVGTTTYDVQAMRQMTLSHLGAAGAFADREYLMAPTEHNEIQIAPGDLLIVRNGPNAMDAGGTFQLAIELDWRETVIPG